MATTPHDDTPPTAAERYAIASGTSDLTVFGGMVPEGHGSADGSVVLAAAFASSLGVSLIRLKQEWDRSSKPSRPGPRLLEALTGYVRREDMEAKDEAERNFSEVGPRIPGKWTAPKTPAAVRAVERANAWYDGEVRLLLGNLTTRRVVVESLNTWAALKGITSDEVAEGVLLWLHPTCQKCNGHGQRKVPNQPSLSGKLCHPCNGTGNAYRRPAVARVVNHMDYCESVAKGGIARALRE